MVDVYQDHHRVSAATSAVPVELPRRDLDVRHGDAGSAALNVSTKPRETGVVQIPPPGHDLPAELISTAGSASLRRLRALVRSLWPQAPVLARDVISAIEKSHPPYRDHVAHYRATLEIEETLRITLLAVVAPATIQDTMYRWTAYGEAGARAGVPLDMILTCHRISSTTVWSALTKAAQAATRPTADALLGVSAAWWRSQDLQSATIASSYLDTAAAVTNPQAEQINATLGALLDGRIGESGLSAAATALDVPVSGPYVVAVVERASELAPRPRVESDGGVGVRRVFWRRSPSSDVAVVLLAAPMPECVGGLFQRTAGVRIGVSPPVAGLGQLDRAQRLARAAVRTCAASGDVAVLDDRLAAALVVSAPEVAARAVERVLGPLLSLDPRQRDLLLDTMAVWLDCGGSTDVASRRLFCHRNTVLNRLRRIEQVCSCSLFEQQTPLLFALALEARRLLGQPKGQSDGGDGRTL